MKRIDVPRLLVTGLHSGVGKSSITLALLHELRRRGVQVTAAITAPNLNVAALYERVTGRAVMCLDPALLTRQQILEGLDRAATGSEMIVIDGGQGLLDSESNSSACSDAEVAALTHTPILFVVDVRGYGPTLAAAVRGVQQSQRALEWAGVALNRLPSNFDGRANLLAAFDQYKAPLPLVSLPSLELVPPVFPQLVSQLSNTTLLDRQFLSAAADALVAGSDIEQLMARAAMAPALEFESSDSAADYIATEHRVRLAVARDSCFTLLFQDNLEILRRAGAELCEFSPLTDSGLPRDVQGIYFPGGYVAEYAAELALNEGLRTNIAAFLARGGVLYAEGSSLAYLGERYRAPRYARELPGVGIFPGVGVPQLELEFPNQAQRAEGALLEYGLLGEAGDLMKGVYSQEWRFERDPAVARILRVVPANSNALLEGFAPSANIFGTYGFWHFGSAPSLATNLIAALARN